MKTLQIDDEVYDHLLRNVQTIGEDASSILRRLLGIQPGSLPKLDKRPISASTSASVPTRVDECIQHQRFQMEREAVGKFLFALSWLSKQHGAEFRKVLEIRGRRRHYFAESVDVLEESGSSVQPRQIPDCSLWVITNNDTPKKKRMLADVMRVLGYSPAEIERLTEALE